MPNDVVNPQITNSIQAVQQAVLTGDVIRHSGAGKAYQSVSQSTAIAVQDATDQLRNMNMIGTTAAGVAMAQLLATGNLKQFTQVYSEITNLMEHSAENFKTIGANAATVLSQFPSGDS